MSSQRNFTSVDLFAGAGGFSIALEQAGFETVSATDINADAVETLRSNQAARIPIADRESHAYLDGTQLVEVKYCRSHRQRFEATGFAITMASRCAEWWATVSAFLERRKAEWY